MFPYNAVFNRCGSTGFCLKGGPSSDFESPHVIGTYNFVKSGGGEIGPRAFSSLTLRGELTSLKNCLYILSSSIEDEALASALAPSSGSRKQPSLGVKHSGQSFFL